MNLDELLKECLKYMFHDKPMFKALTYHSNGRWSADYRTWSKERIKLSHWGNTPEEALKKLLDVLTK